MAEIDRALWWVCRCPAEVRSLAQIDGESGAGCWLSCLHAFLKQIHHGLDTAGMSGGTPGGEKVLGR